MEIGTLTAILEISIFFRGRNLFTSLKFDKQLLFCCVRFYFWVCTCRKIIPTPKRSQRQHPNDRNGNTQTIATATPKRSQRVVSLWGVITVKNKCLTMISTISVMTFRFAIVLFQYDFMILGFAIMMLKPIMRLSIMILRHSIMVLRHSPMISRHSVLTFNFYVRICNFDI